jgi:spermidine synthase
VVWFGITQILIGILALAVTVLIRDLPEVTVRLHNHLRGLGMAPSDVRTWANFILAFSYMLVPTFFMGVAFPLAGRVHAAFRKRIGAAVGEVLTYNTVGAILGAGISGFIMITLFGIERSLQMLVAVNVGFGLLVCMSTRNRKAWNWSIAAVTAVCLIFLSFDHSALKTWNNDHFAIFRNNQTEGYIAPDLIRAVSEVTRVIYYGEGLEATISVTRIGNGEQRMLVNGKVVASSSPKDLQLQFALGHLPMLLHKNPKKVLVVGLGTGMTLGAASVHPGVEDLILVEIEPKAVEAARTYERLNHRVLDNRRLKIIYNDGRNFLHTTDKIFDVITADPIHPWAQGASYLYTREYYQTALERLAPEGIMCQWLPLYELSGEDVRSVVNTFRTAFPEVMIWLTHYDAILIGSRSHIRLNEEDLDRKIALPGINEDLTKVMMGSSFDILSHFVAGTDGAKNYSTGGIINTDDNLYLEFSSPFSVGMPVMENNVRSIIKHREAIWPYLIPPAGSFNKDEQKMRWEMAGKAFSRTDEAHALFLGNRYRTPQFTRIANLLDRDNPGFAPWRFLKAEVAREITNTPILLQRAQFSLMDKNGQEVIAGIFATRIRLSENMFAIMFTDQDNKFLGQLMAEYAAQEDPSHRMANDVFLQIGEIYQEEARADSLRGGKYPDQRPTMKRIEEYLKGLRGKTN